MDEQPKRRFQFSLSELLAIVVLAGIGLFLLEPFLLRHLSSPRFFWPPRVEYPPRDQLKVSLAIAGAVCLGAVVGLYLAGRWRTGPWQRAVGLAIGALAAAGLLLTFAMTRPHPANATSPAAACMAFQEAQVVYHRTDYNHDGATEYAQSLHELLETKPGAHDLQLVTDVFAAAEVVGGRAIPKIGYVCKVLKGQGSAAKGGAKSYFARGSDGKERMTEGFAFVACPAVYGESGRDMFIISHDGTIYEGDFGPKTPEIFEQMTEFNPDPKAGWVSAE